MADQLKANYKPASATCRHSRLDYQPKVTPQQTCEWRPGDSEWLEECPVVSCKVRPGTSQPLSSDHTTVNVTLYNMSRFATA